MHWTRREFLQISGGAAVAFGLGALSVHAHALDGRVHFNDWRALPGMKMTLSLDIESPESCEVRLVACVEGVERVIGRMRGASVLEVEMPMIETQEESFEIFAVVENAQHEIVHGESVEVLAQSFSFGL